MNALEVHCFEFGTQWVVEVIEDGLSISNNAELLNGSCEKKGFNFDLAWYPILGECEEGLNRLPARRNCMAVPNLNRS